MDTQDDLEPALQESEQEHPETQPDAQTSKETPEQEGKHGDADDTVDKRLQDKDRYIKTLEAKLKEPAAKVEPDDEVDWKIENQPRIKLVKDEYEKQLAELKANGAKITNPIRTKALQLAELAKGVKRDTSESERQAANTSQSGTITRATKPPVTLTEYDKRFGLTAERKRELEEMYPDLKED